MNELINSLENKLITNEELNKLGLKMIPKRVVGLQVFEHEDYTFLFNKLAGRYKLVLAYKIEEVN